MMIWKSVRQLCLVILVVCLAVPGRAYANHYGTPLSYDRQTLIYWQGRYRQSMPRMLDAVRAEGLVRNDQRLLRNVHIVLPLTDDQVPANLRDDTSREPFAFFAVDGTDTVYMSVASTLFLNDLSKAYAWLYANGGSMEPIADYMTMIKYHEPEDFAGGHFPTPLEALGVPDGFFDDNDGVDTAAETMALSFFNEARAFIIAHELGHIRYNHSSAGASFAQLQQHERQADAFALDALARAEVVPMGAFLLFLAWANYHDNRWDYESDQSWQASLAEHTHPLTPERMQALATALIARVGSYQSGDRVVITMIANEMANLAALAADEDFQQSVRIVGAAEASIALRSLQSCCVPQNPGTTAVQPFSGTYIGDYVRYTVEGPESLSIRTELRRSGDNVSGTFDFGLGPGTISGLVQGTTLTFSWRWAWTSGQGIMDSSDAGYSFSGAWGYRSSYSNGGTWSGQRTP